MIYLDNAATSFPKPDKVYDEVLKCMKEYCANPGRGGHEMALKASMEILRVREELAAFFGIKNAMQLVFTKNATEALNIGLKGFLKPGDHVITTPMEHNSVIRPLRTLEKNIGIKITTLKGNIYGELDAVDIRKEIKKKTKLIITTLSSNVNGIINPVKDIGQIAKEYGIAYFVDASQGAGSIPINVDEMNINMLAFPGHKGLLGPQGTGGLYVCEGVKLCSLIEGGTGTNSENIFQPDGMPDLLESGTHNTPGVIGLRAGINYITEIGIENIQNHKYKLVKKLHEGIEEIKGAKVYSKNELNNNSGIVAMNFEFFDSQEVSYKLDKVYKIASRAGLHCSFTAHKTLQTLSSGIVRLSPGPFNTIQDIDTTLKALREIAQK